MGSCLERLQSSKNARDSYLESSSKLDISSTQSVSNNSISLDNASVQNTLSDIPVSPTDGSLSSKFSWGRLQSVYANAIEENVSDIQPLVLTTMYRIFCIIENNIGPMSRRFYTCLLEVDKNFPTYYEECSVKASKNQSADKQLVEKIRNHTVLMIHMHKVIVMFLQNLNIEAACDIMKLIAISHTLIKINPTYFNFMDKVMGKFLLSNGFLYEENVEAVVIYFNSITTSICKQINSQQTCDFEGSADKKSAIARENYRQMKRWYLLVQEMQEGIDQLNNEESTVEIPEKPSQATYSTIPTDILKESAFLMKYFVKKKSQKKD